MEYILIDNFNGNINIICKDDGSGEPLIYDSLRKAESEYREFCQNGIIVPLYDIINILTECSEFIDSTKFYLREEDDNGLEEAVNDIIST